MSYELTILGSESISRLRLDMNYSYMFVVVDALTPGHGVLLWAFKFGENAEVVFVNAGVWCGP